MKRRVLIQIAVLAMLLGVWGFSPYRVGMVWGDSMIPTLQSGRWIVIDRQYYRHHRPRRGEIVVFRHDGATYIKRVHAGAGETILLMADGERGARTLTQPIHPEQEAWVRATFGRIEGFAVWRLRVPMDSFFALGDSLGNSIDSRDLGPIDDGELIGRAWPLFGTAPATDPYFPFHHVSPAISRCVHTP
jgi:signal peptidase I